MIRFIQDFKQDFKQIYLKGDPYAFIRFGDGERAIAMRKPISSAVGEYDYAGDNNKTSKKIMEALTSNIPGLYIGISCPCCDLPAFNWYMSTVTAPKHQISYANLFVNSNYPSFQKLDLSNTVLVSCKNGDFSLPERAMNTEWDYEQLLQQLFKVDKPILVAAGPVKCGLILDYWKRAPNRQIIIDIGSALDLRIHGKPTRAYHTPGTNYASRTCRWGVPVTAAVKQNIKRKAMLISDLRRRCALGAALIKPK